MLKEIKQTEEAYINVSTMGVQITEILGKTAKITGKKTNDLLLDLGVQELSNIKTKYKPTLKYKKLAKIKSLDKPNNDGHDHFYIWKNEVVFGILDVAEDKTLLENLENVIERVVTLRIMKVDEINIITLGKELADFLGVYFDNAIKNECIFLWSSYVTGRKVVTKKELEFKINLLDIPVKQDYDDIWDNI